MNKPKILYVDDEEINLLLFEINLKRKYHILTAKDGIQGLEVMNAHSDIKVVVSDMKMPKLSGVDFITRAKKLYPEVSYYILTGFEITDEIQAAMDQGIILKYFQKPFNMNDIDSELTNVL